MGKGPPVLWLDTGISLTEQRRSLSENGSLQVIAITAMTMTTTSTKAG